MENEGGAEKLGEVLAWRDSKLFSPMERVALEYPGIALVSVYGRTNPITGQHVEMKVQARSGVEVQKEALSAFMKSQLPSHMVPYRIIIGTVSVGHRFKKT